MQGDAILLSLPRPHMGATTPRRGAYWLSPPLVRRARAGEPKGGERGTTGFLVARRPEEAARTCCQSWERMIDWCEDAGYVAPDGLLWGSGQGMVV